MKRRNSGGLALVEPQSLIMVPGMRDEGNAASYRIIDTGLGRAAHRSGATVTFNFVS